MKHITSAHGIKHLLDGFQKHLCLVRGLAPATCAQSGAQAREFLTEQWHRAGGHLKLARLEGADIVRHVCRQRQRYKPVSLQHYASSLRALLRFLALHGHVAAALVRAVPPIRIGPRVGPPDYLSPAQLQQLLASLNPKTPQGVRDQALILVLAQMGLRAGEAAALKLDDLDWAAETLRVVQAKGRRERLLPLAPSASQALAHYFKVARPATDHRHVFVDFPKGAPLVSAAIAEYLQRRRQLGFALQKKGAALTSLGQFARQTQHRGPLTKDLVLQWAQAPTQASPWWWARRLAMAGRFARFWVAFDPRTEVPPGLVPYRAGAALKP